MPVLKCPACGARGEVRGTEEFFEERGQWPDGHMPVRKCLACGGGLIVRPRVFPPGAQAQVIPSDIWVKMESAWDEEFGEGSNDEVVAETIRKGFLGFVNDDGMTPDHAASVVLQALELGDYDADEIRAMLVRAGIPQNL